MASRSSPNSNDEWTARENRSEASTLFRKIPSVSSEEGVPICAFDIVPLSGELHFAKRESSSTSTVDSTLIVPGEAKPEALRGTLVYSSGRAEIGLCTPAELQYVAPREGGRNSGDNSGSDSTPVLSSRPAPLSSTFPGSSACTLPPRGDKPLFFPRPPPPANTSGFSCFTLSVASEAVSPSSLVASLNSNPPSSSSSMLNGIHLGKASALGSPMSNGVKIATSSNSVVETSSGMSTSSDISPSSLSIRSSATLVPAHPPLATLDQEKGVRYGHISNNSGAMPPTEGREGGEGKIHSPNEGEKVEEAPRKLDSLRQHSSDVHGFVRSQYRRLQKQLNKQVPSEGKGAEDFPTEVSMARERSRNWEDSSGGPQPPSVACASLGYHKGGMEVVPFPPSNKASLSSSGNENADEGIPLTATKSLLNIPITNLSTSPLSVLPPASSSSSSSPALTLLQDPFHQPCPPPSLMERPANFAISSAVGSESEVNSSFFISTVQSRTSPLRTAVHSVVTSAAAAAAAGVPATLSNRQCVTEEERLRGVQRQWHYLSIIENGGKEPIPPTMKTSAMLASSTGEKISISRRHSSGFPTSSFPSSSSSTPFLCNSASLLYPPGARSATKREAVVMRLVEEDEEDEVDEISSYYKNQNSVFNVDPGDGSSGARGDVAKDTTVSARHILHKEKERDERDLISTIKGKKDVTRGEKKDGSRCSMPEKIGHTKSSSPAPSVFTPPSRSSPPCSPSGFGQPPPLSPPPLLQRRRKSAVPSFSFPQYSEGEGGYAISRSNIIPSTAICSPTLSPLVMKSREAALMDGYRSIGVRKYKPRRERKKRVSQRKLLSSFSSPSSSPSPGSGSSSSSSSLITPLLGSQTVVIRDGRESFQRPAVDECAPLQDSRPQPQMTEKRSVGTPALSAHDVATWKMNTKRKGGRSKKNGKMRKEESNGKRDEGMEPPFSPRYMTPKQERQRSSTDKYHSFLRSLSPRAARLCRRSSSKHSLSRNARLNKTPGRRRKGGEEGGSGGEGDCRICSHTDPRHLRLRREVQFDLVEGSDFSSDSGNADDSSLRREEMIKCEGLAIQYNSTKGNASKPYEEQRDISDNVIVEELDMLIVYPPPTSLSSHC